MQRQQLSIYLTHITKDNLNMGSGHIHGLWSDSAHTAETPINSPRKPSGSILIACLMRKVCHALWKTLGKPYRFLKSHFHSFPFWLSAASSLMLRNGWGGEEAMQVWVGSNQCLLCRSQEISMQEPCLSLGVQTKAQCQGTLGQLY